jgi:hypothetical protein
VSALEDKVKHILQEEWEERALNRAENQANHAEKILKGHTEMPRSWFQSDKERKLEKSMCLGILVLAYIVVLYEFVLCVCVCVRACICVCVHMHV